MPNSKTYRHAEPIAARAATPMIDRFRSAQFGFARTVVSDVSTKVATYAGKRRQLQPPRRAEG